MPGNSGTVSLPTRGPSRQIAGVPGVGFPDRIAGGVGGVAPIPSRLTFPVGEVTGGTVPGGATGHQVRLFTPAIDATAPFYLGGVEGHSIRSTNGDPIAWLRRFFANLAGQETFLPYSSSTPDWTSNEVRTAAPRPGSRLPFSTKHFSYGGYFREAYVDEQLFNQLTDRRHPWPIQKPMRLRVRNAVGGGQPQQTRPWFYWLTRYQPAAAYGQTTATLLPAALTNLLPTKDTGGTNPPALGGSPYGSY